MNSDSFQNVMMIGTTKMSMESMILEMRRVPREEEAIYPKKLFTSSNSGCMIIAIMPIPQTKRSWNLLGKLTSQSYKSVTGSSMLDGVYYPR